MDILNQPFYCHNCDYKGPLESFDGDLVNDIICPVCSSDDIREIYEKQNL